MNMFPSVRNSVTDSVTRPGMAVRGIIKLIPDIRTIDVVGIYDFKINESRNFSEVDLGVSIETFIVSSTGPAPKSS